MSTSSSMSYGTGSFDSYTPSVASGGKSRSASDYAESVASSSTETKSPWYSNPDTSLSNTLVHKSQDNVFGRTFTHIFQPVTHLVDSVFKLIQSVGFAISSVGKNAEQKSELKAKSFYALKSSGNSLLRTISSVFNLFTGYQKEIGLSKLAMNPYTASPVDSSNINLEDLEGLKRMDSPTEILNDHGFGDRTADILEGDIAPHDEDVPPPTSRSSVSLSTDSRALGEGVSLPGLDSRSQSFSIDTNELDELVGSSVESESSHISVGSREVPSIQSAPTSLRRVSISEDTLPSSIRASSTVSGSFDIGDLSGLLREIQPNPITYRATNGVIGRATIAAMQTLGHTSPSQTVTTNA